MFIFPLPNDGNGLLASFAAGVTDQSAERGAPYGTDTNLPVW